MKHRIIEAAVLAAGFVLLGFFIQKGISDYAKKDRVINVKGLAEMEVAADKVIWPIVYKEVGDDLIAIYDNLNRKNQIVVDFLNKNEIGEEEISISAPLIVDMEAERYNNNTTPYRYNVTSVITVSSSKVDLVRKLISQQGSLLKKGVAVIGGDYQYTVQYLFTKLNEIKPKMIEEATKNAREAADKFANDSKSKLGKIKSAYQGQFSINDRDDNTPYVKNVRVVSTIEYYLKD